MSINLIGITIPDSLESRKIEDICKKLGGEVINFYTMDMEEISMIAKYRILPVPTLLIFSGMKVIGRLVKEIPSLKEMEEILEKIGE